MASEPFYDHDRNTWYMKYRPNPKGPWVKPKLGKHTGPVRPGVRPKVPPEIAAKAREFAAIEYRAKHQLTRAAPVAADLAGFLDGYVASHSVSNVEATTAHVRRGVDRFVEFAGSRGVTTLQGVTAALCREYIEHRAGTVATSTLKTERGFLMGAWTRAVDDELIPASPWAAARVKGRSEAGSVTFWTPDEVARLAAACLREWQRDAVLLMANTGLRVSTALALRWSWIDQKGHLLRLERSPHVKTVYSHTLSAAARAILERRREGATSPLVFPRPGGAGEIPYSTIKAAVDRAIRVSKVPAGTPHDLRHSYGRSLALAGVPITVIKSQMGHTSIVMTQRYMATDEKHAASFVEGIDLAKPSD